MNFGSGNHANAKVRGGVETEEQLATAVFFASIA